MDKRLTKIGSLGPHRMTRMSKDSLVIRLVRHCGALQAALRASKLPAVSVEVSCPAPAANP